MAHECRRIVAIVARDGGVARVRLRLAEDEVENFSFGIIDAVGLLSFHDGRPR